LTKQFTLGKKERLKSRKQIDHLFKQGKSFSIFPYKVYYVLNPIKTTQHPEALTNSRLPLSLKLQGASPTRDSRLLFGVGAGTRNFKKAVDRNRIKRLTREAYRLQKNILQQKLLESEKQLNVFFIYTGKEMPDYLLIKEKTTQILNRLLKIVDENNPMDT
jgi:ribonuclease P protein component